MFLIVNYNIIIFIAFKQQCIDYEKEINSSRKKEQIDKVKRLNEDFSDIEQSGNIENSKRINNFMDLSIMMQYLYRKKDIINNINKNRKIKTDQINESSFNNTSCKTIIFHNVNFANVTYGWNISCIKQENVI